NHAGVAAFSLDQFELAQEYLQQAANAGFISDMGRAFLAECTDGIRLWEEELQAREKDATSDLPRVKLTTNKGEIILELFEDQAPGTVGNFVNLVEQGFYDGLTFHRVIANFM